MGDVTFTVDAETAKAVQGFLKVENRQKALQRQQARVDKQSKRTTRSASRGLDQWKGKVAGMIMTYAGLETAVGAMRDVYREVAKARREALEAGEQTATGMGKLAQLTNNPEKLQHMLGESRSSMRQVGMSRREAGALQFSLESAGKADKRRLYAELHGIADPQTMLEQVTTIQNALGVEETGGDMAMLGKFFRASGVSKEEVPAIARAAAMVGQGAKGIGGSDEELLAATAVLSRGEVTPERTGTRLQAFARQIAKNPQIQSGEGMVSAAKQIQGMGLDQQGLYELLGEQRAVKGYQMLSSKLPEVERVETGLHEEHGQTYMGSVKSYRQVFGLERLKRIAEAEKSLEQEEDLYSTEAAIKLGKDWMRTEARQRGEGDWLIGARSVGYDINTFMAQNVPGLRGGLHPYIRGVEEAERRGVAHKLLPQMPEVDNRVEGTKAVVKIEDSRSKQNVRNGGSNGIE